MRTVSVIISTYNGAGHITRQLDSVFAQRGVDVAVLIRDDKSQDNTVEVIRRYMRDYPERKIELIPGENVGYARSFWLGLTLCQVSDYYAFADQDDVWKENKLIRCVEAMCSSDEVPQMSYCRMQRSDERLNRLEEQVEVLKPERLTKKLTLIKTYNYGAATVINNSARQIVCRMWPEVDDLPHDMWVGTLCFWFGRVYYVDEELYYWIRYDTSVTGEGTRKTGIRYRLKKTFEKKSYPNICCALLEGYFDLLTAEDRLFLERVRNYKTNIKDKAALLADSTFKRTSAAGTLALKLGILFGWY